MKLKQWKVGLVLIAGMASCAIGEEKPSTVMTALASTTISGYVDTSAQWNFGTGNANMPPYKFGGASKADGFNLNVVQVRIERPVDDSETWGAGYKVDLWAGPDANVLGTQSILSTGGSDFAIRQAYVDLRMPVGNGIDWKVGVFDAILGYESVEGPANPNFTRSYGHGIEPQTHTGVLGSYKLNDMVSFSGGIANTYGPQINEKGHGPNNSFGGVKTAESQKTYMGSVLLTAPDGWGFMSGSTFSGGIVNGFRTDYGDTATSWYAGCKMNTPVTGLHAGLTFDALDLHLGKGGGETWCIGGYSSYQVTEKLSVHCRGEYLKDRGAQQFFNGTFPDPTLATLSKETIEVTTTAQYDLWKNVISRLELRWDHSLNDVDVFGGNTVGAPSRANAWMLAGNIIYKF